VRGCGSNGKAGLRWFFHLIEGTVDALPVQPAVSCARCCHLSCQL
jgi:hypothetical protein